MAIYKIGVSEAITSVRFPLIVMVVFIHAYFGEGIVDANSSIDNSPFWLYQYAATYVSEILCAVAVPIFYIISGFLFFIRANKQTISRLPQGQNTTLKRCYGAKSNITFSNILKIISNNFYFIKIRKRVKTLFVPYVLWNIIVLISFFLAQSFFPEMMSGANKPIKDFSLSDFIWSFWDTSKILPGMQPYPICFQLWFIRDLMVMSLIAFIVKFVVDRIPVLILIAGFFWIIGSKPIFPGLSFAALFFFSLGAFLSLRNNINSITRQNVKILYLAVIYLVISTLALFVNNLWFGILRNLSVIVGVYLFIVTIPFVMNTLSAKTIKSLAKSSFFIYAYHAIPMTIIIRIAVKTFFPDSNFELLLIYFISPILIIITGYYLGFTENSAW